MPGTHMSWVVKVVFVIPGSEVTMHCRAGGWSVWGNCQFWEGKTQHSSRKGSWGGGQGLETEPHGIMHLLGALRGGRGQEGRQMEEEQAKEIGTSSVSSEWRDTVETLRVHVIC